MKEITITQEIKIGDVYMVRFSGRDSEQHGVRPGVVFQNNIGNKHSPNVIILPMTSVLKKTSQPTHVIIPKEAGMYEDSMVLCENPQIMSKKKLDRYITTLPDYYMTKIAVANLIASSAIAFIDVDMLNKAWQIAKQINKR